MRALRRGRLKLIHYPDGERTDELYDVVADPREQNDLATERPQEVRMLLRHLDARWAAQQEAPAAPEARYDARTRRRLRALGYL